MNISIRNPSTLSIQSQTHRAIKALTVVVMRQRLHPAIARLNGKAARKTFGGEQLVPVGLAVRLSFLQEERTIAKQLATVRASKAFRMEVLANRIETVTLK